MYGKTYIIFNIRITGVGKSAQIHQIGAVGQYKRGPFFFKNCITNDPYDFNDDDNLLAPEDAVKMFLEWTKEVNKDKKNKLVLIAHNLFSYDKTILIDTLLRAGVGEDEINDWTFGFVDTLPIFKHYFPNLESYSLDYLLRHFGLQGQKDESLLDSLLLRDLIKAGMKEKGITKYQKFIKFGFFKTPISRQK